MKKSIYSVHPGVAMVQKWVEELKVKTGRSLDEWLQLVKKSGPPTETERRDWLKKNYNLGTNSAWWLATRAEGKGTEDSDPEAYLNAAEKYVEDMFSGKRTALRPLYDRLLKLAFSIGADVKACPCQTIVPLYRNHVFAEIKPASNTRIDFGLALGNMKTPKRLVDTGGYQKKQRLTRKMEITQLGDIDDEVKRWLKTAYELDKKKKAYGTSNG
jgi:hypothetical protein